MNWKFIGSTFGKGLVVILPVVLTLALLWWLASKIEGLVEAVFTPLGLPYLPGTGIIVAVALVFVAGLLMNARLFQRLYAWFEGLLDRIPLVKSLYGSLRDLMDFVSGKKGQEMNKVVMVDLDGRGRQRLIGFVTRDAFDDLPEGVGGPDSIAVYLPMSYQIGGFTTIVPRSAVQSIDMGLDEAMRFALTAGVKQHKHSESRSQPSGRPASSA